MTTPQFNVRITEEEKEAWKTFAELYTNGKISELVRNTVQIIMRNPSLLDPTRESIRLFRDWQEAKDAESDAQSEWEISVNDLLQQLDTRVARIERKLDKKLDLVLKNQGISKKKIKEELGEDILGELIFDEESK